MAISTFLCVYLLIINLLTFIAFGIDKRKAIQRTRRIPEKYLLRLAVIGGVVGAWFSMILFRHKIKDWSFLPPMILVSISWLIGIIVFLRLNT